METRRLSRFIVAAGIVLSSTFVAAPVAAAEEIPCDQTVVHRLICMLVDTRPIEDLLCAVSGDLCL